MSPDAVSFETLAALAPQEHGSIPTSLRKSREAGWSRSRGTRHCTRPARRSGGGRAALSAHSGHLVGRLGQLGTAGIGRTALLQAHQVLAQLEAVQLAQAEELQVHLRRVVVPREETDAL